MNPWWPSSGQQVNTARTRRFRHHGSGTQATEPAFIGKVIRCAESERQDGRVPELACRSQALDSNCGIAAVTRHRESARTAPRGLALNILAPTPPHRARHHAIDWRWECGQVALRADCGCWAACRGGEGARVAACEWRKGSPRCRNPRFDLRLKRVPWPPPRHATYRKSGRCLCGQLKAKGRRFSSMQLCKVLSLMLHPGSNLRFQGGLRLHCFCITHY